jgi:hypothetical protein
MSSTLLEQYIRLQSAITQYASDLRERVSEEAGQTTVEWLVIMVGLTALATALVGAGSGDRQRGRHADLEDHRPRGLRAGHGGRRIA